MITFNPKIWRPVLLWNTLAFVVLSCFSIITLIYFFISSPDIAPPYKIIYSAFTAYASVVPIALFLFLFGLGLGYLVARFKPLAILMIVIMGTGLVLSTKWAAQGMYAECDPGLQCLSKGFFVILEYAVLFLAISVLPT